MKKIIKILLGSLIFFNSVFGIDNKIVSSEKSYYKISDTSRIIQKISKIKTNYEHYINNASFITGVPKKIIYSFIFIESQGISDAIGGNKEVGLMQIKVASATDILIKSKISNKLNDREIAIISKYLGVSKRYILTHKIEFEKEDLLNPELNILIGAMYLSILLEETKEKDTIRIDKMAIRYNAGYYSYNKGSLLKGSIDEVLIIVKDSIILYNYVLKLTGKNGLLKIIKI